MFWFAIASLTPLLILFAACFWGGLWAPSAVLYMTVCVYLMDRLGRTTEATDATNGADVLSVTLALGHLLLIPVLSFVCGTRSGLELVLLVIGSGLFMGQVSHPNAHELIHHPNRKLRRLGQTVYTSMLIGHHASAHMLVHHVHVASDRDPNSARLGEGFYAFWLRAWAGSFLQGFRAEARLRTGRAGLNPYLAYAAGGVATLVLAWSLGGLPAIVAVLLACLYAQAQIFLADYVQHYGLRRARHGDRLEPAGPQHSWNAPHWYSSALMLNAPRHSDHHMNPGRRFPQLLLDEDMPTLPRSLPVMGVIALIPPLWRRIMDPRVALVQSRGQPFAQV
ncbi:MAG: alkane 1-monooxygenase [Rhodobacteraceae bacterium]|nr:alkane 1-monooxygenase [Paracoccaceae bacterium]